MSWDAAVHGRIRVPLEQREAWLDSTPGVSESVGAPTDWAAVAGHEAWPGEPGSATVRELIDTLTTEAEIQFIEFTWTGEELAVAGFMDKDMFLDSRVGIGSIFAAAARFGGLGTLIGMGMMTASFGYRLSVRAGSATLDAVAKDQVSALDEHPDAIAIEQRVMLAIADLD